MATWHDVYGKLIAQLRERFPDLPEQPTAADLKAAIDALERAGEDVWIETAGHGLPHARPMQFAVEPREILEWARTEGPLSVYARPLVPPHQHPGQWAARLDLCC